jgi:hypothetical protein
MSKKSTAVANLLGTERNVGGLNVRTPSSRQRMICNRPRFQRTFHGQSLEIGSHRLTEMWEASEKSDRMLLFVGIRKLREGVRVQ